LITGEKEGAGGVDPESSRCASAIRAMGKTFMKDGTGDRYHFPLSPAP
jgi:hypothetical protein